MVARVSKSSVHCGPASVQGFREMMSRFPRQGGGQEGRSAQHSEKEGKARSRKGHQHIVKIVITSRLLLTIVTSDESVTVSVLLNTVNVLDCLLEGDVHVSIEAGEHTAVVDTGIQADVDILSNYTFEEVVGASCFRLCCRHDCSGRICSASAPVVCV